MSSRRRILPVAPARARCYNTARVRLAQEAIIMDLVAAVSPMTCAALIAVVLTKPSVRVKGHTVNIFWVVPLIGAAILLLFGTISPREVLAGLTAQNSINPLKILVLFLSMTLISIFLDCAGFFRHLATAVLQRQNASQFRLFALLYAPVTFFGSAVRPAGTMLVMTQLDTDNGTVGALFGCVALLFGSISMLLCSLDWPILTMAVGTISLVTGLLCLAIWLVAGFRKMFRMTG